MDVVNATLVHISQVVRDDVGQAGRIDDQVPVERLRLELPTVGQFQPFSQVREIGLGQAVVNDGSYTSAGPRCVRPATVTGRPSCPSGTRMW